MSKAFEKYREYRDAVKGAGINVKLSSFENSSISPGDGVFYINSVDKKESVAMVVSPKGVLKSSIHINKTVKEDTRTTKCYKNFEKLEEVAKDPAIIAAAKLYDWSMAPKRVEESKPEAEPEFL